MLDPVKNFAKVTVSIGYNEAATTVVLVSGQGAKLPDPAVSGAFNLAWFNSTDYADPSDDPNVEIVRCTVRSTDTLTVTRGQEGIASQTHNISGKTYRMALAPTKKTIDDISNAFHIQEASVGVLTLHAANPKSYAEWRWTSIAPASVHFTSAVFDCYVGTKIEWDEYIAINNKVTLYAEMSRNSERPDQVWVFNPLLYIATGANEYSAMAVEIDVANMDADMPLNASAILDGVHINSGGTYQALRALGIGATTANNKWRRGITLPFSAFSDVGIEIGTMNAALTPMCLGIKQPADNWDTIVLERFEDVAPTGFFLRCINTALSTNLFAIDALGNASLYGIFYASVNGICVNAVKVIGERIIDARIDDTIGGAWDASAQGILDACRDALITHGLVAAA